MSSPGTAASPAAAAAAAPPNKVVGNYELVEKIGTGSFSSVFRAKRRASATTQSSSSKLGSLPVVAVKAIHLARLNPRLKQAMFDEVEILNTLQHANIVSLLSTTATVNTLYLFLEYCGGGDLHRLIRRHHQLALPVTQHFLRQLASGLEFLWRHNLIHRDLKPHNLLLTTKPTTTTSSSVLTLANVNMVQLKIADFGFARHLGEAKMAQTMCGSPLYMCPELLAHQNYDSKCDLWSTGVILFEMMTGHAPYSGGNPEELLNNIQRTELRIPAHADTSPDAVDLLRRLLRRKPAERISYQEFFASKFVVMDCVGGGMHPVLAASSGDVENADTADEEEGEGDGDGEDEEENINAYERSGGGGGAFASPPPPAAAPAVVVVDDAWEFVEAQRPPRRAVPPQQQQQQSQSRPRLLLSAATTTTPLSASSSLSIVKTVAASAAVTATKQQQQPSTSSASSLKRKHASGRAGTFAVEVGKRAVFLAKMSEQIVDLYEEMGERRGGVESTAAAAASPPSATTQLAVSASLVVESMRLLGLALAAAEDALEAATTTTAPAHPKKKPAGSSSPPPPAATAASSDQVLLVQQIRQWLEACTDKAQTQLAQVSANGTSSTSSGQQHGELPNPRLVMYKVALGLGSRCASREMLLKRQHNASTTTTRSPADKREVAMIVEDYSLGLMLLQLLTTNIALKQQDRAQILGFISLFCGRLQQLLV